MSRRNPFGLDNIDWFTLSLFFSLVGIGWIMLFSIGYHQDYPDNIFEFLTKTKVGKQTIWIIISLLSFFFIFFIDAKFWKSTSFIIYLGSLLLLIGVLIFGQTIKGAKSWYMFPGGISFQPSEFAKLATALVISAFLGNQTNIEKKPIFILKSTILFIIPMFLILMQPDAGSALVFLSFFILLFRVGFSPVPYIVGGLLITLFILALKYPPFIIISILEILAIIFFILNLKTKLNIKLSIILIFGLLSISLYIFNLNFYILPLFSLVFIGLYIFHYFKLNSRIASPLLIGLIASAFILFSTNYAFNEVLKPHQQDRINVWLNPQKCDPQGALYNVLQSKIAIGSGGIQGKGFLKGSMTRLNYIPEQTTDFIFCTIGEEQGFIGTFAVIVLFLVLILRLTFIGERQKDNFSKYFSYAIAGILFIHFFINISMTMGLFPIIGIPLPFISKGGSSLLIFSIMLAIVLKLDSTRYSL